MPLDKSGSRASVGTNIAIEERAGKPRAQAVAIALNTAREAGADIPSRRDQLVQHLHDTLKFRRRSYTTP